MLNPREQNPSITSEEVDVVTLIHDYIEKKYHGTGGYCGLGALMVVATLGPDYVLVHGPGHWWAANSKTFAILDPTVDQFGDSYSNMTGESYARTTLYPRCNECTWDSIMMHYQSCWEDGGEEFVANLKIAVALNRQRRVAA